MKSVSAQAVFEMSLAMLGLMNDSSLNAIFEAQAPCALFARVVRIWLFVLPRRGSPTPCRQSLRRRVCLVSRSVRAVCLLQCAKIQVSTALNIPNACVSAMSLRVHYTRK